MYTVKKTIAMLMDFTFFLLYNVNLIIVVTLQKTVYERCT